MCLSGKWRVVYYQYRFIDFLLEWYRNIYSFFLQKVFKNNLKFNIYNIFWEVLIIIIIIIIIIIMMKNLLP